MHLSELKAIHFHIQCEYIGGTCRKWWWLSVADDKWNEIYWNKNIVFEIEYPIDRFHLKIVTKTFNWDVLLISNSGFFVKLIKKKKFLCLSSCVKK